MTALYPPTSAVGFFPPPGYQNLGAMPDPSGDTSGATDYSNWQAKFNIVPTSGVGGQSYTIPPGVYYFNQHLAINNTTKLVGAGVGSADHLLSSATQLRFLSTTDDGFRVFAAGCTFRDFAVINATGAEVSGTGFLIPFSSYMTMDRIGIRGFYDCASFDTGIYWQVNACYFLNPVRYGIRCQNTTVPDAGDNFIGSGCAFWPRSTGSESAIRWETGGGLKIEGNKINGNGSGKWNYGVDAVIPDGAGTSVFLVEANSIEGIATNGVRVTEAGTTGIFGKIGIAGNEFGVAGSMTKCVSIIAPTKGNITSVLVANNVPMAATTNAVELEGVVGAIVGNNDIEGTFSESAISIKNCSNVHVAPNLIVGSFTNAAVNIKSSATPSSDVRVDSQNVCTTSGGQTLVLDSSAGVASTLKRNKVVYDEIREIPGGIGNSTFVTMYQILLPNNLGSGGVLEFSIAGVVAGGTTPDAFAIYGQRLLTLSKVASSNVVPATIGTDVVAGTVVDYQLLCTTAQSAFLQIRLNAAQGGTGVSGQVHVRYEGVLARLVKV